MTAFEYAKYVINLCSQYDFITSIEILLLDEPVVKLKAIINKSIFVHIFYNTETQKTSYALIKENKRIFGADNTKGWHIHPFENPESHIDVTSMDLKSFLDILSKEKDKWL